MVKFVLATGLLQNTLHVGFRFSLKISVGRMYLIW